MYDNVSYRFLISFNFQLLSFPNNSIIKSVIACIFTYKNKALTPYREHFEALLEEKTFKDELVLFKISEEDNDAVVHVEHRAVVMPILLRFFALKQNISLEFSMGSFA